MHCFLLQYQHPRFSVLKVMLNKWRCRNPILTLLTLLYRNSIKSASCSVVNRGEKTSIRGTKAAIREHIAIDHHQRKIEANVYRRTSGDQG